MLRLSFPAVRALLLHQQGLLTPPRRTARKADVLRCIRRMQLLQIDTINVVARSPYLVLHSRLGMYEPRWLEELHAGGKLFEYWSHALCWIPSEDWPLLRSLMLDGMRTRRRPWGHILEWLQKHASAVKEIKKEIRERGPLRASDFKPPPGRDKGRTSVWWNWREEKAALEFLYWTGELMVSRRDKFQRVYDLRGRVLPEWDEADAVPRAEVYRHFIRNAAMALGVATEPWLRDYYRMLQKDTLAAIDELLETEELVEVEIEGLRDRAYLRRDLLPLARKAQAGKLVPTHTALLSPFDPVVWDRRRLRELFGFDYTISVYTPGHAREHGYFVLPVLHRGRLIGRLDPKAHRKDGMFEIRAFHLEQGVVQKDVAWDEVAAAIRLCAEWHGTPEVKVSGAQPEARPLFKALAPAKRRA